MTATLALRSVTAAEAALDRPEGRAGVAAALAAGLVTAAEGALRRREGRAT